MLDEDASVEASESMLSFLFQRFFPHPNITLVWEGLNLLILNRERRLQIWCRIPASMQILILLLSGLVAKFGSKALGPEGFM